MGRFGSRRLGEALVGVAAIAAAVVLVNINLQSQHDKARLRSRGAVAVATVTEIEKRAFVLIVDGHASTTPVHHMKVEFRDEEGRLHTAGFDRRPSEVKAGDTLRVLYDPDSPRRSTIIDSCTFGAWWCDRPLMLGFGFAGVLFLLGAGIVASGALRGRVTTRP